MHDIQLCIYDACTIMLFLAVEVCLPCITGTTCCAPKVWGKCPLPCPKFGTCCSSVDDLICVTANTACAGLKATAKGVLKTAQGILQGTKLTLNAAKAVLEVAKKPVTAAQAILDGVNVILEQVKKAYEAGTKAASFIVQFTLTKILSISKMYFKVELSAASGGKFQCRVKGVLVGNNFNSYFMFDTNNIFGIAKSLADRAASGVSKYIG